MTLQTAALPLLFALLLHGQSQSPQGLADVKTIFVDTLGQGESVSVIRDKIINRLATSGRFQVVFEPEKADAVLTGSVTETRLGTGWDATAVVRLVTKDERILWVSEAKNKRKVFKSPSASSSVADKIIDDLMKAASPLKKRK